MPKAVTTTLHPNNIAVFECIVTQNGQPFWTINGSNASYYKDIGVVPSINTSWEGKGQRGILIQLEVPTTVLFNSSSVTCRAFFDKVLWLESTTALFLLQGIMYNKLYLSGKLLCLSILCPLQDL